jgi:hypothetical protein
MDPNDIILQEVEALEERRRQAGSYFAVIPHEFREFVRGMAERNYPYFANAYTSTDFLEALAQNWLLKFQVFGRLMTTFGFVKFQESHWGAIDRLHVACLTNSASYVMAEPRAWRSPGATVIYSRIPLRRGRGLPADSRWTEARFHGMPREGAVLKVDIGDAEELTTSPLIAVYVAEKTLADGQTLDSINASTTTTFERIDHRTIHLHNIR